MKIKEFDIKNNLKQYLPSLFQLIEGEIRWTSLEKLFEKNYAIYKVQYDKNENIKIRHTLYSIINLALIGEEQGIQFLSYIDNLFKDLYSTLTKNERIHIKKNIADLLEFKYESLHYLGELSVLNCLMKTGSYRLIETEYRKIKNGKAIDFRLSDINKRLDVLIEVVNIELKSEMMKNHDTIQKFLSWKYKEKIDVTDKSGITNYTLIPVLWGDKYGSLDSFLRIKEFYETTNFSFERVELPMVYMLIYVDSVPENRFCSILNILG